MRESYARPGPSVLYILIPRGAVTHRLKSECFYRLGHPDSLVPRAFERPADLDIDIPDCSDRGVLTTKKIYILMITGIDYRSRQSRVDIRLDVQNDSFY